MSETTYIGIDPGTHTGLAVYRAGKLLRVSSMTITQALREVERLQRETDNDLRLYFEDARRRSWFGRAGREKLQGAGSVKRDCAIWQTFCEELGIAYVGVAPKNNTTKLTAAQFKVLTGWEGKTNEHSRDAAMLIYGR